MTIEKAKSKDLVSWLIFILLGLVWGSSFILIKKSLLAFSPAETGALRVLIAFIAFIPLLIIRRREIDWSLFSFFLIVGLTGNGIPSYLYPLAETKISSSVAGVLNGLTPIFTIIIAALIFRHKYFVRHYFGIILGFIGAAILLMFGGEKFDFQTVQYGSYIVLATICYATSVNTVHNYLSKVDTLMVSAMAFVVIGPIALIYLCTTDVYYDITQKPDGWTSLIAVSILALAATALATVLYFKLVQIKGAVFASVIAFVIPIVALFWGVVDGEYIAFHHLIGLAAIMISLYLIKD